MCAGFQKDKVPVTTGSQLPSHNYMNKLSNLPVGLTDTNRRHQQTTYSDAISLIVFTNFFWTSIFIVLILQELFYRLNVFLVKLTHVEKYVFNVCLSNCCFINCVFAVYITLNCFKNPIKNQIIDQLSF